MSLKNIGNIINEIGVKEIFELLNNTNIKSFSSFFDILKVFKESSELLEGSKALEKVTKLMKVFDGRETILNAIGSSLKGLSVESAKTIVSITGLTEAEMAQVLVSYGLEDAEAAEAATILATSGAANVASGSFATFAAATGAAAKAIGVFLLTNPVGWAILAGTAIFGVTKIIQAHNEAIEEARQKAVENSTAFNNNKKSIEDYASEIEELKSKLNDYNISGNDVYNINKRLVEIQTELFNSCGKQAKGIDLVNGKLETQLNLTRELTKEEAKKYLNENYEPIKEATREMTRDYSGTVFQMFDEDKYDFVRELIAEKYSDYLSMKKGGYGIIEEVLFSGGNVTKAQEVLNDFMIDVRDKAKELGKSDLVDGLLTQTSKVLDNAKQTVEKYGEIFKTAQAAKLIADETLYKDNSGKSKTASQRLSEYETSVNSYNAALWSGDASKISEAKKSYQEAYNNIHSLMELNEDFKNNYSENIKEIESNLDTATEKATNFKNAISGVSTDDSSKNLRELSNGIKELNLTRSDFLNDFFFDPDNLNEGSEAVKRFVETAQKLGYIASDATQGDLETFVDLLQELGIVANDASDEAGNALLNLTGTLSDLNIVFNDDSDNGFTKSLSAAKEKLDTLKNAFESYKKGEIDTEGMVQLQTQFAELNGYDLSNFGVGISDALKKIMGLTDETSTGFVSFKKNVIDTNKSVNDAMTNLTGITKTDFIDTFLNGATNKYSKAIQTLVDAAESYGTVDSSNQDSLEHFCDNLIKIGVVEGDLNLATTKSTGVMKIFADAIERVGGEKTSAGQALARLRDNMISIYDTASKGFTFNIDAEVSDFSNLYSSLKESFSGSGLTTDAIKKIKAMYKGLEGYNADKLFERTANGVHLNRDEVKKLQEQYEKLKKTSYANELKNLSTEYENSRKRTEELKKSTQDLSQAEIDAMLVADGLRPISSILDDISNVELLIAEFDGLTSSYNKWLQAQSNGNERDSFESVAKGYEEMQKVLNQGWYGDESLNEYLNLMLDSSRRTNDAFADWQKLGKTIEGTSHSLKDYFTFDSDKNLVTDGLFDFLDDVRAKLGDSFATIDSEGNYTFDFTGKKLNEVAKAFGTTTEFIQLMERAMIDAGFTVEMNSSELETMKDALGDLQAVGIISPEVNLDIDPANSSLDDINALIDKLEQEKAKISVETEGSEEAKATIELLDRTINSLTNNKVTKSIQVAIENGSSIDELLAMDNKELSAKLSIDDSQVDDAREQLESLNGVTEETKITVALDSTQFDQLVDTTRTVTYVVDSKEPDEYDPKDKEATVEYKKDSKIPDDYIPKNPTAQVIYEPDVSRLPTTFSALTRYVNYVKTGDVDVSGKANHKGTAYANGSSTSGYWGLRTGGIALGGELGEELLVRDGRFMTIGANSAEFFEFKPNDIIFNAEQTEQLLTKGKITTGSKRGRAYVEGNAFDGGTDGRRRAAATTNSNNTQSGSQSSNNNNSNGNNHQNSGNNTPSTDTKKSDPTRLDWIEVALDRAERAVNRLKSAAESVYRSFSNRNKNLGKEIDAITSEIELQRQAKRRYNREFENVSKEKGLSEDIVLNIKNGTIDIKKYDEETQQAISEAKKFYDASLDCADSIRELNTSLSEVSKQKFDLIITKYEKSLQKLQHQAERLDSRINRRTNSAGDYDIYKDSRTASKKNITDYQSLISNAEKQKAAKQNELAELKASLKSSNIKNGTEAYYEMVNSIYSVESEIDTLNGNIIEYSNSISESYKNIFDSWSKQYESKLKLIEHTSNEVNNKLSLAEEKGRINTSKYYTLLKNAEKNNISMLTKELNQLKKSMSDALDSKEIEVGSQAYYDMQTAINSVAESLQKAQNNVTKLNNQIRQLKWDNFDFMEERLSRIVSESDFMIDLIDNNKLYNSKGQLNKYGKSVMGLHFVNYDTYMKQAKDYASQLKSINKSIADDPYDTNLIKRKETLIDAYQKSITSAEKERDAIKSLVSEGIELEISALQKLITKYKESLDSMTDIYDYQKKVSDQSKTVASLQKQLTSYAGDTSEEAKARIQKLTVDLESAQRTLQETETNRLVTEQKKMLDNLATEYETVLNKRLDNVDALIEDMSSVVNSSASTINNTLKSTAKEVGYTISDEMKNVWKNASTDIVTFYENGFKNDAANILTVLNDIKDSVKAIQTPEPTVTLLGIVRNEDGVRQKSEPKVTIGGTKINKSGIKKNASGLEKAYSDDLSWVNEEGLEAILSPSNRAIITHISKGDSVLDAEATANLFKFANNPDDYLAGKMIQAVPGKSMASSVINMGDNDISITLPNVKNYDEFKTAMQNDKDFERFLCSITVDPLVGKNKSRKNRFNF